MVSCTGEKYRRAHGLHVMAEFMRIMEKSFGKAELR